MHIYGFLDKLKTRFVVRGFFQICGINYSDTFASTVRFDTLRLFIIIVTLKNLKCHQIDVNNAFTESLLKEKIYMQPSSDVDILSKQVLFIKRSLYDLKQAVKNWHEKCIKAMLKLDFVQIFVDSCLLRHSKKRIMLLMSVNDVNIAAKSMKQVN